MGTTFVSLRQGTSGDDIGFWMNDGVLELWLRFLALHIPESPDDLWLGYKIRNQWLLASAVHFGGCVPHGLDDAAATAEGRDIIRTAVDSLMEKLNKAPRLLSGNILDLLGIEGTFTIEFETHRLVEVGDAFLKLLDGKLDCTSRSTAFMPGSK